jgi:asparagine synthase (glutamine-hydrolysing)
MCGIVGIASTSSISDAAWLAAGRDAMRHRGPDDEGEWWSTDRQVGLAHRRLAIIDLTAAGHQPMCDGSGELCIVFNGEIYNYRELRAELVATGHEFRSESDTEVLLAAYREWGVACLTRLNGMFAMALYDSQRRRMMLARDRVGEKPLFYMYDGGEIRFASELKGLLADRTLPRRIDHQALDCYLAMGFVPGDRCMLQGIRKLPPAHHLVFDLESGESRLERYWQVPEMPAASRDARVDEPALLDELETLLEDSVRRQMVADVPIGILLSGGVDSSLVTAMAVRSASTVKTFTVRFPGRSRYDETDHARLIARHFGTEQLELEAGECNVDLLPLLAAQFDEPMADSSMIPTYMVSRLVRQHCTVALGGDGGDELFGGYLHYSRMLWMQQKIGYLPRGVRAHLARAHRLLPVGFRGRSWLQGLDTDLRTDVPIVTGQFDPHTRRRLRAGYDDWQPVAEHIRAQRMPASTDLLRRAMRMDFENYLAEDILVKVDRASMLTSLEVRAPLLDYRLVEFAFGRVPSHLKATAYTRKVLLKKLTDRVLPPGFDQRRKQGFSIPLPEWLKDGPWREFFRDVLLDSKNELFSHSVVRELLDGQTKGRVNSEPLFALLMFELWRREYNVSV